MFATILNPNYDKLEVATLVAHHWGGLW
jgi:hypothetical protein